MLTIMQNISVFFQNPIVLVVLSIFGLFLLSLCCALTVVALCYLLRTVYRRIEKREISIDTQKIGKIF